MIRQNNMSITMIRQYLSRSDDKRWQMQLNKQEININGSCEGGERSGCSKGGETSPMRERERKKRPLRKSRLQHILAATLAENKKKMS